MQDLQWSSEPRYGICTSDSKVVMPSWVPTMMVKAVDRGPADLLQEALLVVFDQASEDSTPATVPRSPLRTVGALQYILCAA